MWRCSNLSPGKFLCNKCGLFERAHSRPRSEQFSPKCGPLVTPAQQAQQTYNQLTRARRPYGTVGRAEAARSDFLVRDSSFVFSPFPHIPSSFPSSPPSFPRLLISSNLTSPCLTLPSHISFAPHWRLFPIHSTCLSSSSPRL
ncbi:hypothetical protein C8R44DRAFT_52235 [Mycena epipterygia]|nr:hypothetical protein C8R44DRAFT_52235 [Mycena epipterygia]